MNSPDIPSRELFFSNQSDAQPGTVTVTAVFPGEIQGLVIDMLTVRGPVHQTFKADAGIYTVLLVLEGLGSIQTTNHSATISGNSLARIPYNQDYIIIAGPGQTTHYLRFNKELDELDRVEIGRDPLLHSRFYATSFMDCPAYRESIKSAKTLNRMLLPEGYVPRFCMGSVETTGPDEVAPHTHPMLDQLFLGLKNCRATCHTDERSIQFKENTLLHIPLGSRHSVSVASGNTLSYIWFDFFLSLAGQSYMSKQHQIVERMEK